MMTQLYLTSHLQLCAPVVNGMLLLTVGFQLHNKTAQVMNRKFNWTRKLGHIITVSIEKCTYFETESIMAVRGHRTLS